jgi:bifunctional non-homologous end joining protein LigD
MRTSIEKATVPVLRVAGVAISHPERRVEVAPGHTKLDVVRYHERMAAWVLPELAPRPISVVSFDQARSREDGERVHRRGEEDDDVGGTFVRVSDIADVVRIVQNGSCEFQTWGASFPRLERPDRITLDIDPDPALPWMTVQDAAHHVRSLLDSLGLGAFVKTTGGRGLHVLVPITRRHSWTEVRIFARGMSEELERRDRTLFASMDGAERRGRVHVGHARNADGATVVAAYSLRARPGLPVSMPVAWSDLDSGRRPHFDIESAAAAVAHRTSDPWAAYDRSRQTISGAMRRAVGV